MAIPHLRAWLEALDQQRRALRMPLKALAQRAKVSRATVCRILQKKQTSASLESVIAVAHALGAVLELRLAEPNQLIEELIRQRAQKVVRMVQGTMALESQGITDPGHLKQLEEAAAQEIRAKPRKELWMNPSRPSRPSPAKRRSPTCPS